MGKTAGVGPALGNIDEDPTTDSKDAEKWEEQHRQLLACMPYIDLWFEAKDGAYNRVAPLLTSLKWSGGPVGVRVRLEPVEDANELRKLAWRYRGEARSPVRKLPKASERWLRLADRPTGLLAPELLRSTPYCCISPRTREGDLSKQD